MATSSAENESSNTRISGRWAIARAIDRRCRCPPETFVPPCAMRALSPPSISETKSRAWAISSACHSSSSVASSPTEAQVGCHGSGEQERLLRHVADPLPHEVEVGLAHVDAVDADGAAVTSNSRGMSETRVVLPEPVEPTIATVSPASARNEMPWSTGDSGAGVAERDVVELHDAALGKGRNGVRRALEGVARVEHFADAVGRHGGARDQIVMNVAMSTPMRIGPTYCMNANSVPICTCPMSTWMPPNQMTPTTVTFSTSIAKGT